MQSFKQFKEEMNQTVYKFTEEELVEIYNGIDTTTFTNVDDADDYYQALEEENFGDIDERYGTMEKDNIAEHFSHHAAEEEDIMGWLRQDKIKGDHLYMRLYYFKNTDTYGQGFGYGGDMNW